MNRTTWVIVAFFAIAALAAYVEKSGLPFVRPELVQVDQSEYVAEHVMLRLYAGQGQTKWLLLGTTEADTRVVVSSPPMRGVYQTPGFSDISVSRPFTIRIDKRVAGLFWVPQQRIQFIVPDDQLPERTTAAAAAVSAEFKAALNGLRR